MPNAWRPVRLSVGAVASRRFAGIQLELDAPRAVANESVRTLLGANHPAHALVGNLVPDRSQTPALEYHIPSVH